MSDLLFPLLSIVEALCEASTPVPSAAHVIPLCCERMYIPPTAPQRLLSYTLHAPIMEETLPPAKQAMAFPEALLFGLIPRAQ